MKIFIFSLFILATTFVSPAQANGVGYNMMGVGFGSNGMLFGWLFMITFWVAVIAGIIWLVKMLTNNDKQTSLDVLKKRYSKGEITKKEFEQMKKDIA